jgi:4-amino-4-deoxy-L-arabinose transferase-like glycosyltransferase
MKSNPFVPGAIPITREFLTEKQRAWLIIAAIGLSTFAIRLFGLADLPLQVDEPRTMLAIDLDWFDLVLERTRRTHSPVYFLLLKILGLTHESLYVARLLSALFDSLAATIFALLGYRLGRVPAAVAFGFLYLATPILLDLGQTARPNVLLNLFTVILLYSGVHFVMYPRVIERLRHRRRIPSSVSQARQSALAAGFAGSVGVLVSLLGGYFVWVAINLPVIGILWARGRTAALKIWIRMQVVAVLIWLPIAILVVPHAIARAPDYWIPQADWSRWKAFFERVWFLRKSVIGDPAFGLDYGYFLFLVLLVCAAIGVLAARRSRSTAAMLVFMSLAAVPVLIIWIISLYSSIVVARYAPASTIGFLAIGATGLSWIARYNAWTRAFAGIAIGLIGLNTVDYLLSERRHDFRDTARYISDNAAVGTISISGGFGPAFSTHFLLDRPSEYIWRGRLAEEIARGKTVWLVELRGRAPFASVDPPLPAGSQIEPHMLDRTVVYEISLPAGGAAGIGASSL